MKATMPSAWNAQISGKIAEAMALKDMTKTDLSDTVTGSREKLSRLTTKKALFDLSFMEVCLIAEAAGYELEFRRKPA